MPVKSPAGILEAALGNFRGDLTVADASARSGLALRDAEEGLRLLTADRGGHLAATSKGELVYSFPRGVVTPPETRVSRRVGRAVVKAVSGAVRFVVRAWVSVVLVGYALVFLAVLIALAFRGGDDRDSPWEGVGVLLRVIAEALFWTFHPFSPVALRAEPRWMHMSPVRHRRIPFYERVNRFVFGPPALKPDPREQEREILGEIRRQKGRIAPGDVMRLTGLPREQAERLLLRLVVDYQGDLAVSEAGAITYSFADLRTTVEGTPSSRVVAAPIGIWAQRVTLPPLTGNSAGSNLLFGLINGFNLVASGAVLANDLTLERLAAMFTRMATPDQVFAAMPLPPADGIPLVLGAVPFAFSLALFALPLIRLLRRPAAAQNVARQNGWRAVLRQVLGKASDQTSDQTRSNTAGPMVYTRDELSRAWEAASGRRATDADLEGAVRDLGGTIELREDGALVYQFDSLARELSELMAQRARVSDEEALAGTIIFSSGDEGTGIREDARDGARRPEAPASRTPDEERGAAQTNEKRAEHATEGVAAGQLLLEEERKSLEFLDRVMAESKQRRRD